MLVSTLTLATYSHRSKSPKQTFNIEIDADASRAWLCD